MIDISIIVPVYNTEKYLEKCINSLCNQNIKNKKFEIILINDGSTDNSEKIIKKYQKQYPKIIKYISKENGGVSSARNIGLNIAKGKYILFIDSDDFVEENLLSVFYEENKDYDLFVYGYNELYENKSIKNNLKKSELMASKKSLFHFFENKSVRGYTWNKILKREIITKNNLKFDENVSYVEDLPFIIKYLTKTQYVYFCNKTLYNYVQRSGSLINSKFNINKLSALKSYDEMIKIVDNYDHEYLPTIYYFAFEINYELSVRIRISNEKYELEYKRLRENIKKYFSYFIYKNVKLKYKIKAMIKIIFYEYRIKKLGGTNAKD